MSDLMTKKKQNTIEKRRDSKCGWELKNGSRIKIDNKLDCYSIHYE